MSWVLCRQQTQREMQVVGKKKSERLRMHQCKAARWVGDTIASDTYEVQVLPCIILNLRDDMFSYSNSLWHVTDVMPSSYASPCLA